MKRFLNNILALVLVAPMMTSCFDLSEEWYSEVTPDTFMNSQASINSIFCRPFTHAFWYEGIDRWYLQEYTADQIVQPQRGSDWYDGGIFFRLHYHTWNEDDNHIWQTWRGTGMGISLTMECQRDLERIDYTKFGMTQAQKENHLAQLDAMMGYFYLRALDYFGPFPIMTDPLEEIKARSTDKHVFEKAESLLLGALDKVEAATDADPKMGLITKGAVATLLARLYFNAEAYIGENRYDQCAKICQDIIDGEYGSYSLDASWNGPHSLNNRDSKAVIWAYPSEMNYLQNDWWFKYTHHKNMLQYFGIDGVNAYNGHGLTPSHRPDGTLYTQWKLGNTYEKFNDQDLRKKEYKYLGNGNYEGMFIVGKQVVDGLTIKGSKEYSGKPLDFVDYIALMSKTTPTTDLSTLSSTMADGEENSCIRPVKIPIAKELQYRWASYMVVLRLEEVYYMLAECKMRDGKKDDAAKLINKVRRRAFQNYNDPDPVTADNLDKWRMLDEWGIEFLAEGRRRTDLIRWDVFTTEAWWDHQPSDPSRKRFPVPSKALSGNNNLSKEPI